MKKGPILFIALLVFFSLLAAGCSQVASGSADDDDIWNLATDIEYRDGNWEFEEWNVSLRGHRDYFESASYAVPEEGAFSFESISDWDVMVNMWEKEIPQSGNFTIGPVLESQDYLLSFDKPDNQKYLLGYVEEFFLYDEDSESFDEEYRVVRIIEPIEDGNRLYFPLSSVLFEDFMDNSPYYKMFQLYYEDGSPYTGALNNVVVANANGDDYPLEFNVNLVVAGKYEGTSDGLSVEKLADKILKRLNLAMNPGGITVRKVNVLYAKDHPVVGENFPDSKEVIITRSSGDRLGSLDSLARYPGHEGEINLVLGYYIVDEIDESESVGGFSPFWGQIYNGEEDNKIHDSDDCIFMATHGLKGGYNFSSDIIASTALHELGHFFGMLHTSDVGGFDDYEDTPECSNYASKKENLCKDRHYVMFPLGVYDWEYATFTPQQMNAARYYLTLIPHK